jgi:hypothetical protein
VAVDGTRRHPQALGLSFGVSRPDQGVIQASSAPVR